MHSVEVRSITAINIDFARLDSLIPKGSLHFIELLILAVVRDRELILVGSHQRVVIGTYQLRDILVERYSQREGVGGGQAEARQ
jgi:hypothetical protein